METQISQDMHDLVVNHLDKFDLPPKISLYIYTRGGDTMAAYSLIHLLKQFSDEYEVIIPSKARSAGTLMCLGAKNIVMTKQATLGPIDPSLNSHLNPQNPAFPNNPLARVPVSVESIKGFFEYAMKELKVKDEQNLTVIFNNLSSMIHPIVIGNVFRSRSQIKMIGSKLLSEHFKDKDKIDKILNFLCSDSGSHDYPIYRTEAKNDLGLNIETPTMEFYRIIKSVFDDIYEELKISEIFDPRTAIGNMNPYNYNCRRILIESIDGGSDVFVTEGQLKKVNGPVNPMTGIQQSGLEDQRIFEGWKHEQ